MNIDASTVDEYIEKISDDRRSAFKKLRETIKNNIADGFEETMSYGMIGYVVPLSKYPEGYRADKNTPLPFINLGMQKNYIAIYHNGIYADPKLKKWFEEEYKKSCKYKLDMGKSCIRLKRDDDIPYDLIAELVKKITADEWVETYKKAVNK